MSWSNFACFSNKTYPDVVLQFLVKEAHFSIWVLIIMLHGGIIDSLGPVAQPCRYPKHLPSGPLLICLLLIFGQLFEYLDLWRFYLLLN